MNIRRLLAVSALLSSAACMHYVPADAVIPSTAEIATIAIVLPGAPDFSFADRGRVERLVAFLRQECHWTAADSDRDESKTAKILGYQIVIHRADGSQEAIAIAGHEASRARYHSTLSTRAVEQLAKLCGVETVHLGPFGGKPKQ